MKVESSAVAFVMQTNNLYLSILQNFQGNSFKILIHDTCKQNLTDYLSWYKVFVADMYTARKQSKEDHILYSNVSIIVDLTEAVIHQQV